MSKKLLFFALLFCSNVCFSQQFYSIFFEELPRDWQLYPRNDNNLAVIPIKGRIEIPNWKSMSVHVLRNKKPYSYQKVAINYTASKDTGTFVLSPTIKAELAEYDVKVYAIHNDQDSVLMVTRENLVAGDAYIIYGQSNARGWEELDPYTNEFCRTYGFGYDTNQFKWGLSNSDYTGYSFDRQIVGQWGISFQKYIMNTYGIPTCVISHASPGQPIRNLVERNPSNHADISTQYGRLLTYVTQAKLNNAVKGLFYWQGETEASHVPSEWKPLFDKLYKELIEDYPSIQQYYVFQLPLFGGVSYNEEVGVMRDYQRQLEDIYPKVNSFAALGATGWDGFHYKTAGYRQLGTELAQMTSFHFYGEKKKYSSPNIRRAYYSSPTRDEITLAFQEDQKVLYPNDTTTDNFIINKTGTLSLKDFFYLNGRWKKVAAGYASDNKIILKLKEPASLQDTLIKYLPSVFPYSGDYDYVSDMPWVYLGPFIKNIDGYRAFAFHNVKLGNYIQPPVLLIDNITYNQITLSWGATNSNLKYILERRIKDTGEFIPVFETSRASNFIDTNLEPNQLYEYRLRIQTSNSEASSTAEVKTQIPLATSAELNPSILIYPNPAKSIAQVTLIQPINGEIQVWDLSGQLRINQKVQNQEKIALSLSNLENGTYTILIKSSSNNAIYSQKLVVMSE